VGQPLFSWQVLNAFPTALEIPDFDANATDAAVETLQLIADDIKMAEAGA
jgi:phage tail-like protein